MQVRQLLIVLIIILFQFTLHNKHYSIVAIPPFHLTLDHSIIGSNHEEVASRPDHWHFILVQAIWRDRGRRLAHPSLSPKGTRRCLFVSVFPLCNPFSQIEKCCESVSEFVDSFASGLTSMMKSLVSLAEAFPDCTQPVIMKAHTENTSNEYSRFVKSKIVMYW